MASTVSTSPASSSAAAAETTPPAASSSSVFSRIADVLLSALNFVKDWAINPLMNRVVAPIGQATGLTQVAARVSGYVGSFFAS